MDANPRTGIIQTVPYAVGPRDRVRPHAAILRPALHPAAGRGPDLLAAGRRQLLGPQRDRADRALRRSIATLPVLPGREPFGGEILCHDVVEAGLMRGAGWDVWVLPETLESFEAVPANMVDFASRERRWCQGNLQHIGVLPASAAAPGRPVPSGLRRAALSRRARRRCCSCCWRRSTRRSGGAVRGAAAAGRRLGAAGADRPRRGACSTPAS